MVVQICVGRSDEVYGFSFCAFIVADTEFRRIGHAFNVSLPAGHPGNTRAAQAAQSPPAQQLGFAPSPAGMPGPGSSVTSPSGTSHSYSNSIDKKPSVTDFRSPTKPAPGQYNTAPASSSDRFVSEFGERKKSIDVTGPSYVQTVGATGYAAGAASGSSVQRSRAGSGSSYDNHAVPVGRPRSSSGRPNPAQRLTIVNASEDEIREQMEVEKERARRQPSTILESPISTSPPPQQIQTNKPAPRAGFLTAEQEKVLLYNRAVEKVERTQAGGGVSSAQWVYSELFAYRSGAGIAERAHRIGHESYVGYISQRNRQQAADSVAHGGGRKGSVVRRCSTPCCARSGPRRIRGVRFVCCRPVCHSHGRLLFCWGQQCCCKGAEHVRWSRPLLRSHERHQQTRYLTHSR